MTKSIRIMGVINLTPDSFSDGESNLNFSKLNQSLNNKSIDILDLGAHSTAPFNKKISSHMEADRFQSIFDSIKDKRLFERQCSIDTYRIDIFDRVKSFFNKSPIFNDVSGCIDEQLIDYLKSKPEITYVFSHNLAPERERTIEHMNFCNRKVNILDSTREFFENGLEIFERNNIQNKIILDPCFGFSKTYEQNIELMNSLSSLCESFPSEYEWLIGISKKSFLRKMMNNLNWGDEFLDSEYIHRYFLHSFSTINRNIIFRVHAPSIAANLN